MRNALSCIGSSFPYSSWQQSLSRSTKKIVEALIATFPLLLGGLIYLAFRPDYLVMFTWVDTIGLSQPIAWLREYADMYRHMVPDMVIYVFPNGLWLLSYCLLVSLVWSGQSKSSAIGWVMLLTLLGVISEILQYCEIIRGTFDWADLLVYVVASVAGLLIIIGRNSEHEHTT